MDTRPKNYQKPTGLVRGEAPLLFMLPLPLRSETEGYRASRPRAAQPSRPFLRILSTLVSVISIHRIPPRSEACQLRPFALGVRTGRRFSGEPLGTGAFSLLELVLVMALALAVGFLALGGFSRIIEGGAINTGTQMVADCLAEGRQDALAQNMPVEVRLYAKSSAGYDALQLRWREPDGTTPPAAMAVILPSAAAIDATVAHSTLVTTNTAQPAPDSTDPRLNARTRCFYFLPDGSTNLAAGVSWTLTVRAATQSNPAQFPSNWACLALDPATGRAQLYRP